LQPALAELVEADSDGTLKPVWQLTDPLGQGRSFLLAATQIKTIWVPYGA
jgi:aldehyde dehydrogenase (NAD+)